MNHIETHKHAESESERDARIDAIPDIHGHAKGEHKPYAEERPIPYTARMLFLWFYHACRRGSPRYMMVADHMNYLTFEDPAAVNLVRRALKLAAAGDLYGAAETAGVELQHAAVVSEGLRKGMRYSIGAEVDNDPRSRPDAQNIVDAMKPDGMIRSVHFLPITHPVHGEGWMWPFDNPEFADLFDHVGVAQTWEIYMATLLDAIDKLPGHIVGHFYVPAKFGHWPDDETLERYEDQLLEACAAKAMSVEINGRFFYRHAGDLEQREKYRNANLRLLRKAKAAGVGIAIGSDAHSPKDQGNGMSEVLELLDEADVNVLTFPINGRLATVALRVTEDVLAQQKALADAAAAQAAAAVAAAQAADHDGEDDESEDGETAAVPVNAAGEATPAPPASPAGSEATIAAGAAAPASSVKPKKSRPPAKAASVAAVPAAADAVLAEPESGTHAAPPALASDEGAHVVAAQDEPVSAEAASASPQAAVIETPAVAKTALPKRPKTKAKPDDSEPIATTSVDASAGAQATSPEESASAVPEALAVATEPALPSAVETPPVKAKGSREHVAETKPVAAKAIGPKPTPKAASTKAASVKAVPSKATSPKVASPKAASAKGTSVKAASAKPKPSKAAPAKAAAKKTVAKPAAKKTAAKPAAKAAKKSVPSRKAAPAKKSAARPAAKKAASRSKTSKPATKAGVRKPARPAKPAPKASVKTSAKRGAAKKVQAKKAPGKKASKSRR